ncbi:hypothetical protein M427DRAFT_290826 [Gonapodya prolifera JEL478]|uniref:Uncharacterized protein n=1 Tax=Gonapodya prolifera (strain JEL478) TaxID=1344416 RepID=A0A139AIS1_GONPJ|nr:hypothetical protein M427DRAFT_290826 [Gonapodya prolifera JEL478]|eukprot:KXS16454.1 hypothetical protein M427DRAFT_290826 [Gonapodya prolifera JEL478]
MGRKSTMGLRGGNVRVVALALGAVLVLLGLAIGADAARYRLQKRHSCNCDVQCGTANAAYNEDVRFCDVAAHQCHVKCKPGYWECYYNWCSNDINGCTKATPLPGQSWAYHPDGSLVSDNTWVMPSCNSTGGLVPGGGGGGGSSSAPVPAPATAPTPATASPPAAPAATDSNGVLVPIIPPVTAVLTSDSVSGTYFIPVTVPPASASTAIVTVDPSAGTIVIPVTPTAAAPPPAVATATISIDPSAGTVVIPITGGGTAPPGVVTPPATATGTVGGGVPATGTVGGGGGSPPAGTGVVGGGGGNGGGNVGGVTGVGTVATGAVVVGDGVIGGLSRGALAAIIIAAILAFCICCAFLILCCRRCWKRRDRSSSREYPPLTKTPGESISMGNIAPAAAPVVAPPLPQNPNAYRAVPGPATSPPAHLAGHDIKTPSPLVSEAHVLAPPSPEMHSAIIVHGERHEHSEATVVQHEESHVRRSMAAVGAGAAAAAVVGGAVVAGSRESQYEAKDLPTPPPGVPPPGFHGYPAPHMPHFGSESPTLPPVPSEPLVMRAVPNSPEGYERDFSPDTDLGRANVGRPPTEESAMAIVAGGATVAGAAAVASRQRTITQQTVQGPRGPKAGGIKILPVAQPAPPPPRSADMRRVPSGEYPKPTAVMTELGYEPPELSPRRSMADIPDPPSPISPPRGYPAPLIAAGAGAATGAAVASLLPPADDDSDEEKHVPPPAEARDVPAEPERRQSDGFKLPNIIGNLMRRRSSSKSRKEESVTSARAIGDAREEEESEERREGFFERVVRKSRSLSRKRTSRSLSRKPAEDRGASSSFANVATAATAAAGFTRTRKRSVRSSNEELIIEETDQKTGLTVRRKVVKLGPPGAEVIELQDEPDDTGFIKKRTIRRGDAEWEEYWELIQSETTTTRTVTRRITKSGKAGDEYLIVEEDETQPDGRVVTNKRIVRPGDAEYQMFIETITTTQTTRKAPDPIVGTRKLAKRGEPGYEFIEVQDVDLEGNVNRRVVKQGDADYG